MLKTLSLTAVARSALVAWVLAMQLGALSAQPNSPSAPDAPKDCPPVAKAPTQPQIQEGLRNARDRGALWRITKDGRTSYLFGTLHVGKLAWAFPGPQLTAALLATQVLAVEVDVTDPQQIAALQAGAGKVPGFELTERERERLNNQADAACLPRDALQRMHPSMQAITYVVLSGRRAGLDPGFGQEHSLIGFARATKRPVVSLESLQAQLALLQPTEPMDIRKALNSTLDQLESGQSSRQLVRIATAWEQGDLASISQLEWLCECEPSEAERAATRRLIDERNPKLADRITQEHEKGQPVLAAVGLLHMVGPLALPQLLQERGFQVERVVY